MFYIAIGQNWWPKVAHKPQPKPEPFKIQWSRNSTHTYHKISGSNHTSLNFFQSDPMYERAMYALFFWHVSCKQQTKNACDLKHKIYHCNYKNWFALIKMDILNLKSLIICSITKLERVINTNSR